MNREDRLTQLERERLLYRYDVALARGDMTAVAEVLALAEDDPRLARMIIVLNAAYADFGWSNAGETTGVPPPSQNTPETRSLPLPAPEPARTWPGGWLSGALSFAVALLLLGLLAYVALLAGGQEETPVAAPPSMQLTPASTGSASVTTEETFSPTATASSSATPPASATATPSPVPALSVSPLRLTPPDSVAAFPGPVHYAGDLLTVAINLESYVTPREAPITVRLSGVGTFEVTGRWSGNQLLIPLDTTGLTGQRMLIIEATADDVTVEETYLFELLPADHRPARESEATWQTQSLDCCTLHYISGSAAARDSAAIVQRIQDAAEAFTALTGVPVENALDIYFVDRLWGTGGFSGGDTLIISYTDRFYGPGDEMARLEVLARNGFSYVTGLNRPFFRYRVGLAIYLAGGHYEPEPILQRAAAAGPSLFNTFQMELIALREAASVAYMVERFGWETFLDYVAADSGDPVSSPEKTDEAMRQVYGITLDQFESDFAGWLSEVEVTAEERAALDLGMRLHVLRRQYQEYVPFPDYLLGAADETYARDEAIPSLLRKPRAPVNVALELLLANAQKAIAQGKYAEAEIFLTAINESLQSRQLTHPLAADYGAIARLLNERGLEAVELLLEGDRAMVLAIRQPPAVEEISLRKSDGAWEIVAP